MQLHLYPYMVIHLEILTKIGISTHAPFIILCVLCYFMSHYVMLCELHEEQTIFGYNSVFSNKFWPMTSDQLYGSLCFHCLRISHVYDAHKTWTMTGAFIWYFVMTSWHCQPKEWLKLWLYLLTIAMYNIWHVINFMKLFSLLKIFMFKCCIPSCCLN